MDPLSELQDDLTLTDTSQALNQLKLASIDERNWPSDELPDFPKSGAGLPMENPFLSDSWVQGWVGARGDGG